MKNNTHWKVISQNGDKYTFEGLSNHVDELDEITEIGTGSTAICSDTTDIYRYNEENGWNQW